MANASRRSKQKQQTSKKESQVLEESKANGDATKNVFFSIEQAGLFKQLLTNSNEVEAHFREAEAALLDAQKQIQIALVAAGISGQDIIGGNLDGENPYFTIKNGNGIIKE